INIISPKKGEFTTEKPQVTKSVLTEELVISALGDSLTRGIGDDEGLGYTKRITDKIKKVYKNDVQLTNLAVSGATLNDLLVQLDKPGIQYTIQRSNVIVLTIGGNDLFPGWESLTEVNSMDLLKNSSVFQENIATFIKKVRALNSDAPIYWMSLYNPFDTFKELPGTNEVVHSWNQILEQETAKDKNIYIVPTFDLFQNSGRRYLYTDYFHPNSDGYALMSERLFQSMQATLVKGGKTE
ncbi:MAG: GDSL-type esterase/lipase family protein, partial [Bacilli bacterium]